jgi:hypothetical protein
VNENEAERKTMMARPIPARPKGAAGPTPPPPLDELLQKRQATRTERLQFVEDEPTTAEYTSIPKPPGSFYGDQSDPFAAVSEIMHILRKFPPPTRKQMVGFIAELLLE